jgi:hypothetical protein
LDEITWHRNNSRRFRLILSGIFLALAAASAFYLWFTRPLLLAVETLFCQSVAVLLLAIFGLLGAAGCAMALSLPAEVGAGPAGIGFRFPSPSGPGRTEVHRWTEVERIEDHIAYGGQSFAVVLKDGRRFKHDIDPFVQTKLLTAARPWYPPAGAESPAAAPTPGLAEHISQRLDETLPPEVNELEAMAESLLDKAEAQVQKIEERRQVALKPAPAPNRGKTANGPDIRWLEKEAGTNLLTAFVFLYALTLAGYWFAGPMGLDITANCWTVVAMGWGLVFIAVLLRSNARPAGISDRGVHIAAGAIGGGEDRLVPWDDIAKIRPAADDKLVLYARSGGRTEVPGVGRNSVREIMASFEAYNEKRRAGARRADHADNRLGGMENSAGRREYAWMAVSLGLIGSAVGWMVYQYSGPGGLPAFQLFFGSFAVIVGAATAWKAAADMREVPQSVAVSPVGIYIRYRGQVPKGGTGFVAWNELAALEPPEKGDPESDPGKAVVLVKKSGASFFLGPVDPLIIRELRSRAASTLK